ncbi:replication-relaxation family protein [Candidatus Saccharibacteria bacterium]|nr:replication-relaxation family protein [Candidatus Saccharibacteria bacterium]
MKIESLPKITPKQKQIINLLYSFRFLTRIQIQTMMKHKDKKTINLWLKDLRSKDYICWIYNKDHFADKTKPAIYYMGINGIRHLRNLPFAPEDGLAIRYRDNERSQSFIDSCLDIANCCIELDDTRHASYHHTTCYYYETRADYQDERYYDLMNDSELINPDLCFHKCETDELADPNSVQSSYILEIFEATLPHYRLRKRLKNYVQYFEDEIDEWNERTGNPRPTMLLVCATLTDLIYAKQRTRGLISEDWDRDDKDRPDVRFTTIDKLRRYNVLTKEIWEQA